MHFSIFLLATRKLYIFNFVSIVIKTDKEILLFSGLVIEFKRKKEL